MIKKKRVVVVLITLSILFSIIVGGAPIEETVPICIDGEKKLCENQLGVCEGSEEECTDNQWLGCGVEDYNYTGNYEKYELTCDDLDNNCDGDVDVLSLHACPAVADPVCGVDGNTYGNECYAHGYCVEVAHPGACRCVDFDDDGYGVCPNCSRDNDCRYDGDDCDDTDNTIYPNAPELCDGKDNDCDTEIDENLMQVCGSGDCTGTQTCTSGVWSDCSTKDNDCGICALCDSNGECAYDETQDSDCDDGLYCNGQEECSTLFTCSDPPDISCGDGIDCTADSCNEQTDSCDNTPDNSLCDDGNECTDDTCDTTLGCQYIFNTNPCDDGLFCTVSDQCSDGVCSGTVRDCSDNVDCSDNILDEKTSTEVNETNKSKKLIEVLPADKLEKINEKLWDTKRNEKAKVLIELKPDSKDKIKNKIKKGKTKFSFDDELLFGEIYGEEIEELVDDSDIEYIELDQDISLLDDTIPYGVRNVKAPSVWNLTQGSNVKIAVLDSGVSQHDDLSITGGYSVISDDYNDNYGHGTAVTGVISALLNDNGLVGVAPQAEIYAVKIMESSTGDLSDAINGLIWAIDNNMSVISISFGFDFYSQIFKEVVQEAYSDGILLIGAAGNNNGDVIYPAMYDDVIAVGAIDSENQRAPFSSYGYELELVAPGVDVESTSLNNGYDIYSGTSMSAPHVSGVSALIKSYNNSLTNVQIRSKLKNDALDLGSAGKDDYYGYGLVQVNLESYNYTQQNESYFYEIFNITNYKTPEEDYIFWLNGTGSIDDVDFIEGLYLIKKYINGNVYKYKISVSENGTIKALLFLTLTDSFTYNSTSTDKYAWVGSSLITSISDFNENILDAECYDYDWDDENVFGPNEFDECFYKDSAAKTACQSFSQGESVNGYSFYDVCTNNPSKCTQGTLQNHSINTSRIRGGMTTVIAVVFEDCDDSSGSKEWYDADEDYYIFDRKRAKCTGSSYYYEGRYDDTYPTYNYYKTYKSSISCPSGGICNPNLDEKPVVDENGTIPDPCFSGSDLYIDEEDIQVLKQDSQTNFTATIHTLNVNATNVKVLFQGLSKNPKRIIKQETHTISTISPSDTTKTVSTLMTVNFDDIRVSVDSTDIVSETDEDNNQIEVSATKIKAYLNISTGLTLVDAKIETYLKKYVDSVSELNAEVTIAVGNPNYNDLVGEHNSLTLSWLRWGYTIGVKYNGKVEGQPYNAIVGSFYKATEQKTRIFVYGNEIEGTIAAVKRLIKEKDKFLTNFKENKVTYLGKYDIEAYSVWDYLKNTNNVNLDVDSGDFANVIESVLNDELYEEEIYYIKEPKDNTELRLKHLGPTYSSALINASGKNPIILSRGIHSNLLTWEDFGKELAYDEHKNVWLIEMVGGPNQDTDCGSNCPDYTFSDLKTYYYPALIAGVQHYSESTNASYIGYSLGCSAALESLELYNTVGKSNAGILLSGGSIDLSSYPFDTFVAIACPGNFTHLIRPSLGFYPDAKFSTFVDAFNSTFNEVYPLLSDHTTLWKLKFHILMQDIVRPPTIQNGQVIPGKIPGFFEVIAIIFPLTGEKMSKEIYQEFYNWMNDPNEPKLGKDVSLNNFAIIEGRAPNDYLFGTSSIPTSYVVLQDTDGIVPIKDNQETCKNIISNNKYYVSFPNKYHFGPPLINLPDGRNVKGVIKKFLDDKQVYTSRIYDFNTNCGQMG